MQTTDSAKQVDADGLFEFIGILWGERWLIVLVAVGFAAAGATYALLAPKWYQADVVMLPADTKSLSAGLSQLGNLASLAGISIGGDGEDQEPLAVLKSRDFAAGFIEENNLLPVLFADDWDAAAGRWKDASPEDVPDIRDGVRYFDEYVRAVSQDKKTGIVTLSITWKDAKLAADWANMLAERVNARVRGRALTESEQDVEYLKKEMASTNVASLQQSISTLLESEMQKMLMARGRAEYAFKIIDRAVVPKKKIRPKRALIVMFSGMLGGGAASFFVLLRHSLRGRQDRRAR